MKSSVLIETAGRIASTRSDLLAVLAALRQEPLAPHLEVETYTGDILPEALKTGSKADDIARRPVQSLPPPIQPLLRNQMISPAAIDAMSSMTAG